MPSKSEKHRRSAIKRSIKAKEHDEILAALPISLVTLNELFGFVDSRVMNVGCDHSLRHAREFINEDSLPEHSLIAWLEENGGYCDCEVVLNVEGTLNDD